jgi:hypothetical protein
MYPSLLVNIVKQFALNVFHHRVGNSVLYVVSTYIFFKYLG